MPLTKKVMVLVYRSTIVFLSLGYVSFGVSSFLYKWKEQVCDQWVFFSMHRPITNMYLWLHCIILRLDVLSPFCGLSMSGVNDNCIVNETLDLLPRTTISLWIHWDFVSSIVFEPCKNLSTLSPVEIGNLVMHENKCWSSLVYSSTYPLWERGRSLLRATIYGLTLP